MKISIVAVDGIVVIDGVARAVDLSEIDPTIHVLQFDTDTGKGRVWFKADTDKGQADVKDLSPYQKYVDAWEAAAPPPPPPPPPPGDKRVGLDELVAALVRKGVVSMEEIEAEVVRKGT